MKNSIAKDDVAYAAQINKNINSCCNNFCAQLFPKILLFIKQLYLLFLKPALILVTSFFYNRFDNKLYLSKVIRDSFMICLNPLIVTLDCILPINPTGGCGFPLVTLLGRFLEWLDLLTSLRHLCQKDSKWTVGAALWHTLVGILSCTLALFGAFYYALITLSLIKDIDILKLSLKKCFKYINRL